MLNSAKSVTKFLTKCQRFTYLTLDLLANSIMSLELKDNFERGLRLRPCAATDVSHHSLIMQLNRAIKC